MINVLVLPLPLVTLPVKILQDSLLVVKQDLVYYPLLAKILQDNAQLQACIALGPDSRMLIILVIVQMANLQYLIKIDVMILLMIIVWY